MTRRMARRTGVSEARIRAGFIASCSAMVGLPFLFGGISGGGESGRNAGRRGRRGADGSHIFWLGRRRNIACGWTMRIRQFRCDSFWRLEQRPVMNDVHVIGQIGIGKERYAQEASLLD